jgi:hypothetical protein
MTCLSCIFWMAPGDVVIENESNLSVIPKVNEQLNLLKETVTDDIEHLRISEDQTIFRPSIGRLRQDFEHFLRSPKITLVTRHTEPNWLIFCICRNKRAKEE